MTNQEIADLHQLDSCELSYAVEEMDPPWAMFWIRQRPDILAYCASNFADEMRERHRVMMEANLLLLGFSPEQAAASSGVIVHADA